MKTPTLATVHAEHRHELEQLERLRSLLETTPPSLDEARIVLDRIDQTLDGHIEREEAQWFPTLVARLPDQEERVDALVVEHNSARAALTALSAALKTPTEPARAAGLARDFLALYRRHCGHELTLLEEASRRDLH